MISVVIPAYNEAQFLAGTVEAVCRTLAAGPDDFELVVVENGSTDDTYRLLRELAKAWPQVRPLSLAEANYGLALKAGVTAAAGEQVVIFDVDYVDLDFLHTALEMLRADGGPTIVVGTKRGEGAVDRRPVYRRLITTTFAWTMRVLFGLRGPDTHGIKAFDRMLLSPLVAKCISQYDLFDTELIVRAERAGLAVAYLPVEVRELRPPRSAIIRRVPRTVAGLLRLRAALWRDRT